MYSQARIEARQRTGRPRAHPHPVAAKPAMGLPDPQTEQKCACGGGCAACASGAKTTLAQQQAAGASNAATTAVGQDFNRSPTFGLKTYATDDEVTMGRTAGEFIGDVARPVGSAVGNAFGSVVGAITGIDISSSTTSAAT